MPHVGGGTWSTYFLSQTLASKGHKITIVAPNVKFPLSVSSGYSNQLQSKNRSLLKKTAGLLFPRELGAFLSVFPMFISGLRYGKKAQVIVTQFHPNHFSVPTAFLLSKILKRPLVIRANDIMRDMHDRSKSKHFGLFYYLIAAMNSINELVAVHSDLFFVVCTENEIIFKYRMNRKHPNFPVLLSPNGFDAFDIQNRSSRSAARLCLGIKESEHVLLFVGRFSGEEYGTDILLKAFSLLIDQRSNSRLFLVGDSLPQHLQLLAVSLGIEKKIRTVLSIPHKQVMDYVVASDICIGPILPTLAIPLKVLEYMACGKPIVTGKGSVSQDLSPSFNFVESEPDPEALSQAFLRIIDDPNFANTLSMRAKLLSERFSWQSIANNLEGLMIKLLFKKEK